MVINLTLGFRHGSGVPVIIADQSTKPREHVALWKAARRAKWHPEFARIEMWSSNQGRVRWVRLANKAPDGLSAQPEPVEDQEPAEASDEIPTSSPNQPETEKPTRGRRR